MTMNLVKELFERHSDELYVYLIRYVGDPALAKDIVGDVFVKMMKELKEKKADEVNWKPWLYRVATNCAISGIRKRKVRKLFLIKSDRRELSSSEVPDNLALMSEEGRMVKEAITALSDKYRSVLLMQVYQEMSYQEIGDALDINMGTVKSRINEAKKRVRDRLESYYEE